VVDTICIVQGEVFLMNSSDTVGRDTISIACN